MTLVGEHVFYAHDDAGEFTGGTFFDFSVDFDGAAQRLVFIDGEKSIEMCLFPDGSKMEKDPVDTRRDTRAEIALDF